MTIPRCLTCSHPHWAHFVSEGGERFCETSVRHPAKCRCPRFVVGPVAPVDDWASIISRAAWLTRTEDAA